MKNHEESLLKKVVVRFVEHFLKLQESEKTLIQLASSEETKTIQELMAKEDEKYLSEQVRSLQKTVNLLSNRLNSQTQQLVQLTTSMEILVNEFSTLSSFLSEQGSTTEEKHEENNQPELTPQWPSITSLNPWFSKKPRAVRAS